MFYWIECKNIEAHTEITLRGKYHQLIDIQYLKNKRI